MSEAPQNSSSVKSSSSQAIPIFLLLLCLAAAGGGYWYLAQGSEGFANLPLIGELLGKEQKGAQPGPSDMTPGRAENYTDAGSGTESASGSNTWNLQEEANRFPGQQTDDSSPNADIPDDETAEPGILSEGGTNPDGSGLTGPQAENGNEAQPANDPGENQSAPGQNLSDPDQVQSGQSKQEQTSPVTGTQNDTPPAIIYGQGKAASPGGNVVRGDVPDVNAAVDTKRMYDGSAGSRAEDSIVSAGFVEGLARFLVENYWPAGTHPMAKRRPVTTADIKWANLKYGAQLEGFSVGSNTPQTGRQKVLNYVLMPSMINGLYHLYSERFVAALEYEALTRPRPLNGRERTLTGPETAQMFGLYANQARAVSGTMRSYFADEHNRNLVQAYIRSEEDVHDVYQLYSEVNEGRVQSHTAARDYQGAVIRREQARERIASALRTGGNTRGLDTDSLLFVAMWLHRRQAEDNSALFALADVLEACAARLEHEQSSYETMLRPSAASAETAAEHGIAARADGPATGSAAPAAPISASPSEARVARTGEAE